MKGRAYYERWAQGPFSVLPLKDWTDECERPLTMKLSNGLTVALAEAEMIDYLRGKFRLSGEKPNTLQLSIYDCADVITAFGTPWRVICMAETPGKLIEGNDIMLNLNEKSALANTNTDWIKPSKAIRVASLIMQGAISCVDFFPFTRYLVGAADYTVCYNNKRVKNTHSHQLALSVIYYIRYNYSIGMTGRKMWSTNLRLSFSIK